MKMAATGVQVSDSNEGGQRVTVWKSAVPQTVAGFNFGRFKVEEAKLTNPDYLVRAYANEEPPDEVKALLSAVNGDLPSQGSHASVATLGNMSTTPLLKKPLPRRKSRSSSTRIILAPAPYQQLAVTQQTACNYG